MALRVRTERMVAGGDALARDDDGRVVFVRGALPGELVDVELTDERRDFARGLVRAVLEPSPDRVAWSGGPAHRACGGCDWQHVAVAAQRPAKVTIVVDALRRTAKLPDAVVVEGASVPAAGYRTTVRVVGTHDRRAGFRQERSHDTVEAASCPVVHPNLAAVLAGLDVDPGTEVTLRCSVATGEVTARWDGPAAAVAGLPESAGVGDRAHLHEVVAGHRLRVSMGSFFQSGPTAAALLVDAVRRAAPELAAAPHVVDAYAGVGLFAVAVAPPSAAVTAIESSRWSAADAVHNLAGRAATVERREVAGWRPDTDVSTAIVVADPARTGLGRGASRALASAGAATFVLVSCDPVSLARDARLLAEAGYVHERTEVLDLFPMTHHVETVTRFTR